MKKNGVGKFFAGALVGAGLGVLFAPQKGEKTREELKKKINELIDKLRDVKVDEVTELIENKVNELKEELSELDKEKVLEFAKEKAILVKDKAEELVNLAIDKGTPVLRDAATDVKKKAIAVAKNTVDKLEKEEKAKGKETKKESK